MAIIQLDFLDKDDKILYVNEEAEIGALYLDLAFIPRIGETLSIDLNFDGIEPFLIKEEGIIEYGQEDEELINKFFESYSNGTTFLVIDVIHTYEDDHRILLKPHPEK